MSVKTVMASRLLSGVLTSLLMQGCLLPQDESVYPDQPPEKNHPPTIRSVVPLEQLVTLLVGPNCNHRPFSATVEDQNRGDSIHHRWFIDPDNEYSNAYFEGLQTGEPGMDSPKDVRDELLKPPSFFYSEAPTRFGGLAGQVHKLVLVVADEEFLEKVAVKAHSTYRGVDGGTQVDPSYTAFWKWDVTLDKTTPCQ